MENATPYTSKDPKEKRYTRKDPKEKRYTRKDIDVECEGGNFKCEGCKGKLKCNNCEDIEVTRGSLEILAYNITRVYCFEGSEIIVNAYDVGFVHCDGDCHMIINAYHAGEIDCGRMCNATMRVNNGTKFYAPRGRSGCKNKDKILHNDFEEFCVNLGYVTTITPALTTTEVMIETTGN